MGEILHVRKRRRGIGWTSTLTTKWPQAGILTRQDRGELIDGEIIDMNPIGSPHAGKTNRLARLFAKAAADGRVLTSIQNPLRLDAYNEPEPDLMLLRPRADDYETSHPSAADVFLLVEVSDSSLAYDRGASPPSTRASASPKSGSSTSRDPPSRSIASRRRAYIL